MARQPTAYPVGNTAASVVACAKVSANRPTKPANTNEDVPQRRTRRRNRSPKARETGSQSRATSTLGTFMNPAIWSRPRPCTPMTATRILSDGEAVKTVGVDSAPNRKWRREAECCTILLLTMYYIAMKKPALRRASKCPLARASLRGSEAELSTHNPARRKSTCRLWPQCQLLG